MGAIVKYIDSLIGYTAPSNECGKIAYEHFGQNFQAVWCALAVSSDANEIPLRDAVRLAIATALFETAFRDLLARWAINEAGLNRPCAAFDPVEFGKHAESMAREAMEAFERRELPGTFEIGGVRQ